MNFRFFLLQCLINISLNIKLKAVVRYFQRVYGNDFKRRMDPIIESTPFVPSLDYPPLNSNDL